MSGCASGPTRGWSSRCRRGRDGVDVARLGTRGAAGGAAERRRPRRLSAHAAPHDALGIRWRSACGPDACAGITSIWTQSMTTLRPLKLPRGAAAGRQPERSSSPLGISPAAARGRAERAVGSALRVMMGRTHRLSQPVTNSQCVLRDVSSPPPSAPWLLGLKLQVDAPASSHRR
jgi:hypothetical protein